MVAVKRRGKVIAMSIAVVGTVVVVTAGIAVKGQPSLVRARGATGRGG